MIVYASQRGAQGRLGAAGEAEARAVPVLVPETADKPRIRFGAMNDLRPSRGQGDSE